MKYSDAEVKNVVDMILLLNEIRNSEYLSTHHENVILKRDKKIKIEQDTEYKHLYTFQHPRTRTCSEPGKCGFILKKSKEDSYWKRELCTVTEDYTETGIHFHDTVSAADMFMYASYSGNTATGDLVTVAGWWRWWNYWLPNVTHKRWDAEYIAYNVSDYLVASRR